MATTQQGTINLDCIAADPYSRYLYGIGSANEGTPTKDGYTDSSAVLVRSNASPASLADITWTVISHVKGKDVSYNYLTFTSVDCAVNGDGHFTAFFRSPYRAVSQVALLSIGIRYDPSDGTWISSKGHAVYGWDSDRYVHKSYYTRPEDTKVVHIRTDPTASVVNFGTLSYNTRVLSFEHTVDWREEVTAFLPRNTNVYPLISNNYDYTRQGFFTPYWSRSRMLVFHKDTFYLTAQNPQNATCPVFRIDPTFVDGVGIKCDFQGPPINTTDNARDYAGRLIDAIPKRHLYAFGGDRNGTTFFGAVFRVEDVLKIFTTEKQEGRKYLEHNLIRKGDTSFSNFVVDQNFQVVGGLSPGQEPFVVALTSAGLYQFTIFGPSAGIMEGPINVKISNDFNSLPQRVVTQLKDKISSIDVTYEEHMEYIAAKRRDTFASIGGAVASVVVLAIGALFWRWRRNRRQRIQADGEEKDKGTGLEDPPISSGKHEVHSIGLIPEDESEYMSDEYESDQRSDQRSDGQQRSYSTPNSNTRLPSYTYQNHIRNLDFSSHPRPNITTTVGDAHS